MISKRQHLLGRFLILSQPSLLLLLAILPKATWAQDCIDYFPDAVSNNERNGRIEFSSNARVINSPDNILESRDIRDSAGTNVSCNGVSCSESGSVVARSNYNNFPRNNNDITVAGGGFLSLAPGDYDDITVNSSGRLSLNAGDYHLRGDLKVSSSASIVVSGSGRARIFIRDKVEFKSDSQINAGGGTAQLLVYARKKIDISTSVSLKGLFYARDNIDIKTGSQIVGAVTGKRIKLQSASSVTYDAAAISGDFGSFCSGGATMPSGLLAEWRMDATSWSGVTNEVIDSGGNNYNGTALGMTTTSGLVCNAGDFSEDGVRDYLNLNHAALNGRDDFSISVWAQTTNNRSQAIVSGSSGSQHNELIMWFPSASSFQPYLKGRASGGSISTSGIGDGSWHHLLWTRAAEQNCLYVDGALRGCKNRSSSTINIASGGLIIGQEQDSLGSGFSAAQDWQGLLDELTVFDNALSASEAAFIYSNQLAGNNWDGSSRICPVTTLTPLAEYRMDESSWSGIAGEVVDSINGINGTAVNGAQTNNSAPAIAGSPGTCRYGEFDGNDYINSAVNISETDAAVVLWFKTNNANGGLFVAKAGALNHGSHDRNIYLSAGNVRARLWRDQTIASSGSNYADGNWHHLAYTYGVAVGGQQLYIDGALVASGSKKSSDFNWQSNVMIGYSQNRFGGFFIGSIDEVKIYDSTLTTAQIQNIMDETRPCSVALDHYQITHSGSSPACLAAPITVRAHDSSGLPIAPSTGTTINVSTSDGLGSWSVASSASGVFLAGSAGGASYTFANGESEVGLFLAHSTIANGIDIDVSDGSVTDQDGIAEDDPIDFVEAGFIFLANGVVDNIGTQISGKDSTVVSSLAANQTVALQAVRTDTNTGACVAAIQSPQDVNLSYECRNPTTCESTATLTLAGANIASNNNGSSSNSTTVPLSFDTNGIAQLGGVNYNDAGLICLHAQSNLVVTGAHPASTLTGSSNEFVVKPAGLCVQAIATTLADPTCGAPYYDCSKFVAAATDFELEVSGRAWGGLVESNSALCNNAVTPNFVVGPINLTHNLIAPSVSSGGAVGSIAVASTAINDKGKRTVNQQFSEVGVIDITARFPTPSPYINNETIAASSSAAIGRFTPAKFTLTGGSIVEACSSATAFTYMGQNFVASYTLNAVNALGAPTTNYAGDFAKAMQSGWPQFGGVDGSFTVTSQGRLDASAGTSISWAPLGATAAGQGLADSILQLSRAVADGPYVLAVGVQVEDTDEVRIADNLTLTIGSDSFAPIGQSNQRYGRVRVENAFGSELAELSVPVKAEYFDAIQKRFQLNTDDSCTALVDTDIAITDASDEPIVPSDTSALSPVVLDNLTDGISEIIFAAPGLDNEGSLNIDLNVANWLKFNWLGAGDVNPTSQITFGTYRGNDRVIYRHEVLQ